MEDPGQSQAGTAFQIVLVDFKNREKKSGETAFSEDFF
jgi:hypothetical protein